jgi:hypothetical protein
MMQEPIKDVYISILLYVPTYIQYICTFDGMDHTQKLAIFEPDLIYFRRKRNFNLSCGYEFLMDRAIKTLLNYPKMSRFFSTPTFF